MDTLSTWAGTFWNTLTTTFDPTMAAAVATGTTAVAVADPTLAATFGVPAPSESGGFLSSWQPWAIGVGLLVGLFLLVALLHEAKDF